MTSGEPTGAVSAAGRPWALPPDETKLLAAAVRKALPDIIDDDPTLDDDDLVELVLTWQIHPHQVEFAETPLNDRLHLCEVAYRCALLIEHLHAYEWRVTAEWLPVMEAELVGSDG